MPLTIRLSLPRRSRFAVALAFALVLVMAACDRPAFAGTYEVAADCNSARGAWAADASAGMAAYNTCSGANPIGIVARVALNSNPTDKVPYGSYAEWRFTAPPYTGVVAGRMNGRWNAQRAGWQTGSWGTGTSPLVACFADCETTAEQRFSAPGVSQIWFRAACYRSDGCYRADNGQPAASVALTTATLTLDDPYPAAIVSPDADNLDGRWFSGSVALPYFAGDLGSGVRRVELWTHYGGSLSDAKDVGCDPARPAPCPSGVASDMTGPLTLDAHGLAAGTYTGILRAIDYSGGYSDHTFTYHVDNSPPLQPRNLELAGPDGWRRANGFRLQWTNPPTNGGAAIVAAHYKLCPAGSDDDASGCVTGESSGEDMDHLDDVEVPRTGAWRARVWLEDAAGNDGKQSPSDPVVLRFDNRPPSPTAFEASDPSDPQRLEVRVADDASGVSDGQIELARHDSGEWQALPTRMTTGRLRAYVDDRRLADGLYDLRAIATDAAGNTSIGTRRLDGDPAQVTSPIRVASRLTVGFLRVRHHGRRGHRHATVRLLGRLRTRYRRHPVIAGRLVTRDGQPLAGQRLIVTSQTPAVNSRPRVVGVVDTDKHGRFRYRTTARTSRTLTFEYAGGDVLRPAVRRLVLVVPASSTIHVHPRRILNGHSATFTGRLRGGHIPRGGKDVVLQYYTQAIGWRLFGQHIRTDRHGRWRFTYPFQGVRGTIRFPLRLSIAGEAAYPFASGHSRTINIVVRGL